MAGRRPIRVAYLVTHPIHYQLPLLRRIAADPEIELTVFFQTFHDQPPCSDLPGDIRHEVLPALDGHGRPGFFRPLSLGLWRRLWRGRFDVLWVHGYARLHHLTAMAVARLAGLRVLVRDEATAVSRPRGALRRLAKRGFFGVLRHLCHGFLSIGSLNAAYYRANGIPEDRLFPVPYAVDNDAFRAGVAAVRARRPELRRQLGLEDGAPVILYVGRLVECKRPGDLMAAFALACADAPHPRPYLLMVGEGELRPALEAEASRLGLDRVRLLGFRAQEHLPAYYDLADIFVLPSAQEPWAMVVNEAMNCGLAVVASDRVGAAADLVRDGENGVVFTAGDVDGLAAALRPLLADPARRQAMAEAGLAIVGDWNLAAAHRGLRQALGLAP
jgi:glycosyltransferase involved in cell wall biosynthesis